MSSLPKVDVANHGIPDIWLLIVGNCEGGIKVVLSVTSFVAWMKCLSSFPGILSKMTVLQYNVEDAAKISLLHFTSATCMEHLFFKFIISFDRVMQILLPCLQALIFCLLVDLFPWRGFSLIYYYDYYVFFSSFFIFIWIFFGVSNSLLNWIFIAWIVFVIPGQAICLCLLVLKSFSLVPVPFDIRGFLRLCTLTSLNILLVCVFCFSYFIYFGLLRGHSYGNDDLGQQYFILVCVWTTEAQHKDLGWLFSFSMNL